LFADNFILLNVNILDVNAQIKEEADMEENADKASKDQPSKDDDTMDLD
jgi:hypothetical protein